MNSKKASPDFLLRPTRIEDIEPYTLFLSNPDVTIWLDDFFQKPITRVQVEGLFHQDSWCRWAIECENKFVGLTALTDPDLSRGIARFFIVIGETSLWGENLGTNILKEVLKLGFDSMGLRKINSDYLEPNIASQKIHEQNGFKIEGTLRKDCWREGKWVNRKLLSLLREEYKDT
ncbi:MAG: GNAT family protein [Nitrospinota bacterium]|nr:GNAT family protein [Nitrospinota bacterium]